MKEHNFKLLNDINNIEYKNMVIDLIADKLDNKHDFYVKMLKVKIAYRNFTNEIGIVIVAVCKPNTEEIIDFYFVPAWPFALRTDADIRAYDSLVEMYIKDRDELIEFRDISA